MSWPWWGRDAVGAVVGPPRQKLVRGEFGLRPDLYRAKPDEITAELRTRRPSYTPEWSDPPDRDAGGALVELFGVQLGTVARRLNRLPDKALIEFLDLAGVAPVAARPSSALVEFKVSDAAEESVSVAAGFQVGARPADGSSDLVVFETQADLFVAPAEITQLISVNRTVRLDVAEENLDPETSFAPLGEAPEVGSALLIGLSLPATTRLTGTLSFGIRLQRVPGSPPPIASGGVSPTPLPVAPVLAWEALVKSQFQPLEIVEDETSGLWRSGIVTVRLPPGFDARAHLGDEPLHWLRLRLIYGGFESAPRLSFIRANMTRVEGVRTIRDEVLEPVDSPPMDSPVAQRVRIKNTPVVPGSLVVEADDPVPPVAEAEGGPAGPRWREVGDLASYGPTDRVFTLDPVAGLLTFGNDKNGAALPPGFRNVRAVAYKVGSGAASAVGADEINTLLNSAPFLVGVTNPLPASGGTGQEAQMQAVRRGPETIRARGRTVTLADYALMARFAPGADIRNAHAISGFHPGFPGRHHPGVVAVLVVPNLDENGPPIPDQQALRAVSKYLSEQVAPAGVEVVTAAPAYREIRAEVGFVADQGADSGRIARAVSNELDGYLHPVTGGDGGEGWPFGAPLVFADLLQRLLNQVAGIRAIPHLRLIVDGVPQGRCSDVALDPTQLFWPLDHQVFPMATERGR